VHIRLPVLCTLKYKECQRNHCLLKTEVMDMNNIVTTAKQAIGASHQLPKDKDFSVRCSALGLGSSLKGVQKECLTLLSSLVRSTCMPGKPISLDKGDTFEGLVEYLDALCDRVDRVVSRDSALDADLTATNVVVTSKATESAVKDGNTSSSSSSRSIKEKPQAQWKHLIDNNRSRFVPRLRVKHNSKVPLQDSIVKAMQSKDHDSTRTEPLNSVVSPTFGHKGDPSILEHLGDLGMLGPPAAPSESAIALPHPYEHELNSLNWREDKALQLNGELYKVTRPSVWRRLEDTPLVYVDSEGGIREMIEEIKHCSKKVIGIDVEHHQLRSYRGFVCLIQISTE
jgi:hypothetical protein